MRKFLLFTAFLSSLFALSNDDVIVNYYMDECLWGKVIDFSGNGYFAEPKNDANTSSDGVINNDGNLTVNNYLVPDNSITVEGDYTVKLWIKWPLSDEGHTDYDNDDEDEKYYFNIADRSGSDDDFIYFEKKVKDGVTKWFICSYDNDGDGDCEDFDPPSDGWHMLSIVANSSDKEEYVYIDKDKVTTLTAYVSGDLSYIGASDFNDDENGQTIGAYIDEYIIFNKALSDNDIEKIYDRESDGKNFDGSQRLQYFLCTSTDLECDLGNGVTLSTYNIEDYTDEYPQSHSDYVDLENNFATEDYEFGNGVIDNIDSKYSFDNNPYQEDPDDKYMSIIEGYIYIPEPGTYSFAVNGDDAVEVLYGDNSDVYYGWYGAHGSDDTDHHFSMSFGEKGYYKLKFRHQDWTGDDSYQLYWKKPGDDDFTIVPNENLFYCESPEPYANYRMDECEWDGSDGDVKDSSENGFDGTSQIASTYSSGIVNRDGDFTHVSSDDDNDNDDDLVVLPNDVLDGMKRFTVMMWVKTDQNGDHKSFSLLSAANDDTDNEALMYFPDGTHFRPYVKGVTGDEDIELDVNLSDGNWHQVVWIRYGKKNCIVVDGDTDNEKCEKIDDAKGKLDVSGLVLGQDQDSVLGGYQSSEEFNGYMDEVKIFNVALNSNTIKNFYINEKHGINYNGDIRPKIICVTDTPTCSTKEGILLSTYDISDSDIHYPDGHSEYNDLESSFAKDDYKFGSGGVDDIDTTGKDNNPFHDGTDDYYLSIFDGYIYIPKTGTYSFAVNGDDAVEVLFSKNENVYYGWYGAHGADGTDHNFEVYFYKEGYYKLKFRHEDWTGDDNYQLYWKKPGDDEFSIVPKDNLVYCTQNSGNFDAWDVDEDVTSKVIKTKLVSDDFNLSVVSLNNDGNESVEFNGTVCVRLISEDYNSSWQKLLFEDEKEKNETFNISRAVKNARINIQWLADENVSCPIESEDSNESNSTDNFALRPEKFVITDIPDSIKAGNEFNITVQAVDVKGNPVKDYNESIYINGQSVDLEYNETKTNCETGTLEKISGGEFKDGEANITLKYSEAGDVNLTLREVNASEFASVDSDDTNETQRLIQPVSSNVKVGIDHFKISATLDNYDKEGNFTYYDADMNLASVLDINITAQNKDNETVKNYNSECYAKDVDINISNLFTYNNKNLGVSTVKYYFTDVNGDKSDIATADMNTAINIAYSEGNFTTEDNGSTHLSVYMNFDRNDSYGANPMIVNTDEINVSDSDVLSEEKNISGSAVYLYGNILLDDVIANSNEFNKTYSFVIYDENSSDTIKPAGKEMLINWYENTIHEAKDGNVSDSEIVISSDYNSSDKIDGVDVSVKDISAGKITFDIKRTDSNVDFAVVHLLSPNLKWLWYSKYSNRYDISESSTCLNHFCFSITWQNINSYGEVGSGNFKGTEANVTESNTTKRGVKIFR